MQTKGTPARIPLIVKLTAVYTALMFCVIAATGIALYFGVAWYIGNNAQKAVELSKAEIAAYLAKGSIVDEKILAGGFLRQDVLLIVADSNDKILFCGNADGVIALPPRYRQFLNRKHRQVPSESKDFYFDQIKLTQNNKEITLTLVRPLSGERSLLNVLVSAFIAVGLVVLLLSISASYWLSRRILAPIKQLTEATRQVSVNQLEQQVPVSGIDDELQELTRNFNSMIIRLQRGVENEKRFVSDASHELRTPLTIISGYADMLERWGKDNPETLCEGLRAIKVETARMKLLVENLLELARTDQAVIDKRPFAIGQLLAEVVGEYRAVDQNHNYKLTVDSGVIVAAEQAQIRQLLRIIIDNSIKYTPVGGSISLAAKAQLSTCEISVTDSGCGIADEDLTHVFERFYRSDKARSTQNGGLGIGLALARRIVELHDGQITIQSESGSGTVVTVQLPLG
ncbi:MAG: HAMP domain-containing sensor histidine kinase [Bacillota bacterium]